MLSPVLAPDVRDELEHLALVDWRGLWGDRLTQRPSPNRWAGRKGSPVRCVVWHVSEGSEDATVSWLTNPTSDASSNDVIARDGRIIQLVDGGDAPWTNGLLNHPDAGFAIVRQAMERGVNANLWSYTIECVGHSSWGVGDSLTAPQIVALIGRTAQACMEYRLTGDLQHILRHSAFDSVTRGGCPGYSAGEMIAWVDAVRWLTMTWRGW